MTTAWCSSRAGNRKSEIIKTVMAKTECSSKDGITVGLIDSLITICRVLRKDRKLLDNNPSKAVGEALADLRSCDDVQMVVTGRRASAMEKFEAEMSYSSECTRERTSMQSAIEALDNAD